MNYFTLVSGVKYFSSVHTDESIFSSIGVVRSKNIFLFGNRALLQLWPNYFKTLFSNNLRVVELNPRCITSWLSLLTSRLLKRGRTVTWGHLLNRAGEVKRFSARQLMLKMADGALFYTKGQMDAFNATAIGRNTISGFAPNSVVYAAEVTHFDTAGTDFVYVGRLVSEKKPVLLLQAFLLACQQGLPEAKLHIVGAGPELPALQALQSASPFGERVVLHGHNSNYDFLKSLYQKAVCSVSPGYVGLSITQSLSFGRPMLISKDEPHAPEIEAFLPGENGEFFTTDDVAALAQKLTEFYQERQYWAAKSASMARQVLDNYTYEAMAAGYLNLIERVKNHG